ncbi:MAG: HAMP domain-containing histidine kinase [Solobacterium sp.]|nr:HAMP domain-containing histidine kinase [Solobacterium sp.]
MKRIYLWIRELSLTQQLITIVILVIGVFGVFLSAFLTPSIDVFTRNEMYRMLHSNHESSVYYLNRNADQRPFVSPDSGIIQGTYDPDTDTFRIFDGGSFTQEEMQDIRRNAGDAGSEASDYILHERNANGTVSDVQYSVTRLKDGRLLITLLPGAYEEQFRTLLVNSVVNMNVVIAGLLFFLLLLWVASLIHPLNQIRNYANRIKNDEEAELNVNRRDEIGEVADALRDMQEELEKQNQEKEEMIQNISHDLKTPIATIRSYGESIKDGIYPYGTLEKSIDVIIEHADRLDKKVRSLITLNKMGYLLDDCPEGDTLNMNDVIDKVLLSLKVIRPEITFERIMDPEVYFHGDEDPWRIVVENLIDNALRYAVTRICIQLHDAELIIFNDGKPIDQATLNKMFQPYEKGTDGQFGLGLSIVYRVVTTYGYRVEAANLPDGVQFRIWKEISRKEKREKERARGNRK